MPAKREVSIPAALRILSHSTEEEEASVTVTSTTAESPKTPRCPGGDADHVTAGAAGHACHSDVGVGASIVLYFNVKFLLITVATEQERLRVCSAGTV